MIFGLAKQDCIIEAREMFSFLPLVNNSITAGLRFLLPSISDQSFAFLIWIVFFNIFINIICIIPVFNESLE